MYTPAIFQKHKGRWDYNTINIIAFSNQKCDITQINCETSVATQLSILSVFITESWGRWDVRTFWFITLYSFSGHLHMEKTTRNEKAGNEVVSIWRQQRCLGKLRPESEMGSAVFWTSGVSLSGKGEWWVHGSETRLSGAGRGGSSSHPGLFSTLKDALELHYLFSQGISTADLSTQGKWRVYMCSWHTCFSRPRMELPLLP